MILYVLHPLLQVYSSSVAPQVKKQCLATIAQILRFNTPHTLASLLVNLPAAGLVAALLTAPDSAVAAQGMQVGRIGSLKVVWECLW
jgi:hypothetical protein